MVKKHMFKVMGSMSTTMIEQLDEYADKLDTSRSELIRRAVRHYIDNVLTQSATPP